VVYTLRERDSNPVAPTITVIPAKAGIHCARRLMRVDHERSTRLGITPYTLPDSISSGNSSELFYRW
jgi:hypothetical protein